MEVKLLAVGDVVGETGLEFLTRRLRTLQRQYGVHFTVVNGENASGVGATPSQVAQMLQAGADVVTMGNHTWNRLQIIKALENEQRLLRPANFTGLAPGRGVGVYEGPWGLRIAVVNLIGRCELDYNADIPFFTMNKVLKTLDADLVCVDFHAEATSEKGAMAWHLDGRVSALWGTHTHVPTADCQILPQGLGFVTDLGFTGPKHSVLGVQPRQSLSRFLGAPPTRYEPAEGPRKLNAVLFTIDTHTRRCVDVQRVDEEET